MSRSNFPSFLLPREPDAYHAPAPVIRRPNTARALPFSLPGEPRSPNVSAQRRQSSNRPIPSFLLPGEPETHHASAPVTRRPNTARPLPFSIPGEPRSPNVSAQRRQSSNRPIPSFLLPRGPETQHVSASVTRRPNTARPLPFLLPEGLETHHAPAPVIRRQNRHIVSLLPGEPEIPQASLILDTPPNGFRQQHNDCWIDSWFYAIFVPINLRDWFFLFLNECSQSHIEQIRNFETNVRAYLVGIESGNSQEFLSIKQRTKKNIVLSIIEVFKYYTKNSNNKKKKNAKNFVNAIKSRAYTVFNGTGIIDTNGNGDPDVFFKVITIINSRLLFIDRVNWLDELITLNYNEKPIQKYITKILTENQDNTGNDIVVINASWNKTDLDQAQRNKQHNNYLRLARTDEERQHRTNQYQATLRSERLLGNETSVLQEILNIGPFSLGAVIRGDRYHFTTDFKFGDNWYNYNNQGGIGARRIIPINVATRTWQGLDGLFFIFRRR